MGMLFNTEQTTKMVALINRHFGHKDFGGAIDAWRDRVDDVDPSDSSKRKRLVQIVKEYEVQPDSKEDALGRIKARWHKWLKELDKTNLTAAIADNNPPGGWPTPSYPTAKYKHVDAFKLADNPTVGQELCRQIFNFLMDPNCVEIGFTIVPSSAISINQNQWVKTSGNYYIGVITINTKRIDEI